MAEEKKLSVGEVRKTIAVSLAAAFGFVIALLWNEVVKGGLKVAGIVGLLVLSVVPRDGAMRGLGLDGLAVGSHQNRGHEPE